ncbi:MAG: NUDIX domain-containing protein [Blastocatellia bacterium]
MELKFGKHNPEAQYRQRPGAYAIIFNPDGRFAAVQGQDKLFLPGGGIDPGESPEDALIREVREECAREVVIIRSLCNGTQYFVSKTGEHWEFQCSYFEAQFGAQLDNEPEHILYWLDAGDARKLLAHEIHGWVVTAFAQDQGMLLEEDEPLWKIQDAETNLNG